MEGANNHMGQGVDVPVLPAVNLSGLFFRLHVATDRPPTSIRVLVTNPQGASA